MSLTAVQLIVFTSCKPILGTPYLVMMHWSISYTYDAYIIHRCAAHPIWRAAWLISYLHFARNSRSHLNNLTGAWAVHWYQMYWLHVDQSTCFCGTHCHLMHTTQVQQATDLSGAHWHLMHRTQVDQSIGPSGAHWHLMHRSQTKWLALYRCSSL